jgi:hypothetical protein
MKQIWLGLVFWLTACSPDNLLVAHKEPAKQGACTTSVSREGKTVTCDTIPSEWVVGPK